MHGKLRMAGKRYHYDAKGKLKGYSTKNYQGTTKSLFLGLFLLMTFSLVGRCGDGDDVNKVSTVDIDALAGGSSAALDYIVTGPANVRSDPTAEGSHIVGSLASGDRISAEAAGGDATGRWVKLVRGPFSGKFVWRGNVKEVAKIKAKGAPPPT
jgi:hypothetical protein